MATKKTKLPPSAPQDDKDVVSPAVVQRYKDKFINLKGTDVDRFSKESLDWFRGTISKTAKHKQSELLNSQYGRKSGTENSQLIGKLYFFKYKAENPGDVDLNVYDQYPMIFIFSSSKSKEGKLILHGLNIHYLAMKERQILLQELLNVKSSKTMRPQTRLKLTWDIIKSVSQSLLYERAVHAYRVDRFQSRLIEVPANDWAITVFLNLQNWIHMDNDGLTPSGYRTAIRKKALEHTKMLKARKP